MAESAPRVLQVLGSSSGGVARHVGHVADIVTAAGVEVEVAGPAAVRAGVCGDQNEMIFHAVEIRDRPRPYDCVAVRDLRALFGRFDIVHAHGLRAGALTVVASRLRRRRPRIVVTLHNLPVGGVGLRLVAALLEQVVARGADVVLGVSGDLVSRARARGARNAERALVPAPVQRRTSTDRAELRASLGVVDRGELLVTVARLAPQKGLDLLLDAAGLLASRQGRRGAGAGAGPLEPALAARIADEALPVVLLGRRADAADLMAASDVVVQTSVWEGQPLVLQEALGLGCRVVATEVGGTGEVTSDAAVLVPAGDPRKLAHAIAAVLDDPGDEAGLARRARDRAGSLPTRSDVLVQLRHVYAFDAL